MTKSDNALNRSRPKLREAVRNLMKMVEKHPIGARLPSDRTLAETLEISNITVSTAMQELERMGWIERRSRSGTYRLDSSLKKHIAIYSEMDVFHRDASRFWGRLIQHLRYGLAEVGLRSVPYIGLTAPDEDALACTAPWFIEDVTAHRISGIIAFAHQNAPWRNSLDLENLPIIGGPEDLQSVSVSHIDIVTAGVRMLAARGRRRIALMVWAGDESGKSQVHAFAKAMSECGIAIRHEWVRGEIHPSRRGAGWEELREIWTAIPDEKPDGLIVADDILLSDAILAFPTLGITPGRDLDIVAHVNRGLEPPGDLPLIRAITDTKLVAQEMVKCVRDWLKNGPPEIPAHIIIKPTWEFPEPSGIRMERFSV